MASGVVAWSAIPTDAGRSSWVSTEQPAYYAAPSLDGYGDAHGDESREGSGAKTIVKSEPAMTGTGSNAAHLDGQASRLLKTPLRSRIPPKLTKLDSRRRP